MAATEPTRAERRRLRRAAPRGVAGSGIPWLAAGIGALASRPVQAQSFVDARLLYYKESDDRTQVLNPVVGIHQDLGPKLGALDLLLAFDSISGASPTGGYPTVDTTTSASGKTSTRGAFPMAAYSDTRKAASLSWGRRFGSHLPSIDVSYAKENDYTARSFGLSDSWTLFRGRGTLHGGVSFSRDIVAPVTTNVESPKNTDGYALGFSWVLGERDLLDVSGSLMNLSGDLDDPYKIVPLGAPGGTLTTPDHRPDTRSRRAIVAKYGHSYTWDGALKLTYRYYWDDWSVKAHTLEISYDQRAGESSDWIWTPSVRLYTQSAASFYGQIFPAPQTYLSADYRLSSMYSILGGLAVSKKLDERMSASLAATVQSQMGRDRVTPTSSTGKAAGSPVSAADMTVFTLTAGFTFGY